MSKLISIFVISLSMGFQAPQLGTIEVEITGWEDSSGQMIVALFNEPGDFLKKDYKHVTIKKFDGKCVAVFKDIPIGTYAASVFHDKNMNGELDTNMFGFPKEPYGFSNNAVGYFGPPNFSQSSFEVGSSTRVSIKLR